MRALISVRSITPTLLAMLLTPLCVGNGFASGDHHDRHAVPTLKNQTTTQVTIKKNTVTLSFGPIDLPSGHEGELAASMPKHYFALPKDMYLVGYKSAVFTKDGKQLPQNYLHHILLINTDKKSVSCPGEPLFFAGAGLEMTEARFPEGFGVKLGKGQRLMSVVAFYHKAPPTKDVMATFTMEMAPEGIPIQELDVYQVGVNIVCYSKFADRGPDQTDEGIRINPGVSVHSAPLKFSMDGCVRFAYPHGHDDLLLIALDNTSQKKTLLRTVPDVAMDGRFIAFQPHQVYRNPQGFSVTTRDDYEITMVHHHALHNTQEQHGMGNYLLYMTPGVCPGDGVATLK